MRSHSFERNGNGAQTNHHTITMQSDKNNVAYQSSCIFTIGPHVQTATCHAHVAYTVCNACQQGMTSHNCQQNW